MFVKNMLTLTLQGVSEYEPRVVEQLLNFMYRHVADILQDAEVSLASGIRTAWN